MMAFVGTFVCVHKEESWTHRIKHLKSESSEEGTVGERSRSDGRSWKRRCCREPQCRELRDDTTSTRTRCSTGGSCIAKGSSEVGRMRSLCRLRSRIIDL